MGGIDLERRSSRGPGCAEGTAGSVARSGLGAKTGEEGSGVAAPDAAGRGAAAVEQATSSAAAAAVVQRRIRLNRDGIRRGY